MKRPTLKTLTVDLRPLSLVCLLILKQLLHFTIGHMLFEQVKKAPRRLSNRGLKTHPGKETRREGMGGSTGNIFAYSR